MLPVPNPPLEPDAAPIPERSPLESDSPPGGYRVSIPVFEGPIDLLLYLIKKNELDIHEVSLASIAKEYLEYVEIMRLIDLERAGEFIVVASTLMKMKSRSLFLSPADEEVLPGEETEREALVRYLLEYQKLGGAAEKLAEKEALRRGIFPRAGEKNRIMEESTPRENAPDYVLFDLLAALRDVLSNAPKTPTHEVELLNISPEMKQREIMDIILREGKADFLDLVGGQPKLIVVITFIAMLELIRKGMIRIRQSNQFGRISIFRNPGDAVPPGDGD
jgi:segregation and condensation protein A